MVIHAKINAVSPSATLLQSNLAPKKYVVVKNHVREINKSNDNNPLEKSDSFKEVSEEKVNTRKRKSKTSVVNQSLEYKEDNDQNSAASEICQNDIEELRQVYSQCKSVIYKIKKKYGHLLNLDNDGECEFRHNKKIVFNEDGQQLIKDTRFEKNICLNDLQLPEQTKLQVEYTSDYNTGYSNLPDSLIELGNILKEPIDFRLRRYVINKIKFLREEYQNGLKEDKRSLVKKFKENPHEDLLGFEGTNLSTISGYPT